MGNCMNCGASIKIGTSESKCLICGENPYICWSCKKEISGEQEECSLCGFYICDCGVCSQDCKRQGLELEIKEIFNNKLFTTEEKVQMIAKLLADLNSSKGRLNCPKGVPISYAKCKLRKLALRLNGFCVKDEKDKEGFDNKCQIINVMPVDKTWTISQIKEEGTYGIELREASNMGICLGLVEKTQIEKNGEKFDVFKRIKGNLCKECNFKEMISKKLCPKCKEQFDDGAIICNKCVTKKGDPIKLRKQKSHLDFCNLPRLNFSKAKKEEEDGEDIQ